MWRSAFADRFRLLAGQTLFWTVVLGTLNVLLDPRSFDYFFGWIGAGLLVALVIAFIDATYKAPGAPKAK
jgi:hypothetical protein